MLRRQAFKFRIEPTGEQQRKLRQFAGACRFVFSKALALQQANHEVGGKFIGYVAMARQPDRDGSRSKPVSIGTS